MRCRIAMGSLSCTEEQKDSRSGCWLAVNNCHDRRPDKKPSLSASLRIIGLPSASEAIYDASDRKRRSLSQGIHKVD